MLISWTLRNKPHVNYGVLNTGSEEFLPPLGNLELGHTSPHGGSKTELEAFWLDHTSPHKDLKSELKALETENET